MKLLRRTLFIIALMTSGLSSAARAENDDRPLMKLPQEITFAGDPKGLTVANVFGDPGKPGVYVQRVHFPAGIKVPPHWHPDDMRTVIVVSGTLYFGFGEQWDEKKLTPLPAGSFFYEPSHVPHFAWAKDGEVVVQVTAIGPTAGSYMPQTKPPNQ